MQAYDVVNGGPLGALGATVSSSEVTAELATRGYSIQVHEPVHHVPTAPTLTKTMAISVAIDEVIVRLNLPRTSQHPYRCPSGGCPVAANIWSSMVSWCVTVANGYLAGTYALPSWAQSSLHSGTLHGVALSGLGGFAGFSEWMQENDWFVKSVGDAITNYGEHLTSKNVQDAIKANTDKALSKEDALALVQALSQRGSIPAGKAGTVAQGAAAAASPSWIMPAMIGGAVLVVLMLMKK